MQRSNAAIGRVARWMTGYAGTSMTQPQILASAILIGMMLLFIWGRLRYDLVAIIALLASLVAGTVEPAKAFLGFSDDIVIIVASALVVSAAIAKSGIVETALARITARVTRIRWQLTVLVASVTFLSAGSRTSVLLRCSCRPRSRSLRSLMHRRQCS